MRMPQDVRFVVYCYMYLYIGGDFEYYCDIRRGNPTTLTLKLNT